jgi:hypothetical protein
MIKLEVDEKELKQIQKDLDKLLPFDRGTKTIVRQAMRKAMKPVTKELRSLLKKNTDSGDLVKSIGVFDIKNKRTAPPVVGVGPRKRAKGKQEGSDLLPTGYMIFLEYGTPNIPAQRNLDKAESSQFSSVMSSIVPTLRSIIDKRFKKRGL